MIGYHYSPTRNRASIKKHGLLVPTKHPKIVEPVVCSQGHRNPHISLGPDPYHAWLLSGAFLYDRYKDGEIESYQSNRWDLYQVFLGVDNGKGNRGIRYRKSGHDEIKVRQDIPPSFIAFVGTRIVGQ